MDELVPKFTCYNSGKYCFNLFDFNTDVILQRCLIDRLRARIEGSSYKNVTGHLFHSDFSLQDGIFSKPTITCLELHKTQKTLLR